MLTRFLSYGLQREVINLQTVPSLGVPSGRDNVTDNVRVQAHNTVIACQAQHLISASPHLID